MRKAFHPACDYISTSVLVSFWLFCPLSYLSYRIKLIYNFRICYNLVTIVFQVGNVVLIFLLYFCRVKLHIRVEKKRSLGVLWAEYWGRVWVLDWLQGMDWIFFLEKQNLHIEHISSIVLMIDCQFILAFLSILKFVPC